MQKVRNIFNPEPLSIIFLYRDTVGHFSSLCSFYAHSCRDPVSRYCIFCDQLQQAEPLSRTRDTDTMANSVVELLNNFAEFVPSEEEINDIIKDEDLGMNSIKLSFLDYFDNLSDTVDIIELN